MIRMVEKVTEKHGQQQVTRERSRGGEQMMQRKDKVTRGAGEK